MDNSSAPFSTTINPTTTISNTSLSTSNVSLEHQNMSHVHFPDNTGGPPGLPATPSHPPLSPFQFPPPYISPYDPNMMTQFPHMQTFGHPMNSSHPMGQSEVMFGMQNIQPQGWSSHQPRDEEDRGVKQAWSKMAREKRKQARQKNKSGSGQRASSISEETITTRLTRGHDVTSGESNVRAMVPQKRDPHVFCAPDGKGLDEILTKKLQNSDVSNLGRIVLPKRDAEEKLPVLHDKEGIDILLKDVYSDLRWSFKYKYWVNNKSRMYVLENTGEFVNHYKLQMGDSVTLYEDELKNLYVSAEKVVNPEVAELSSHTERLQAQSASNYRLMQTLDTVQAKEDEDTYLAVLIKELEYKKEEAAGNSLWTVCDDGCSSTGTEHLRMGQHSSSGNVNTTEGALHQVSEQATVEAATSSSMDQTPVADQQNNFDDGFRGHGQ